MAESIARRGFTWAPRLLKGSFQGSRTLDLNKRSRAEATANRNISNEAYIKERETEENLEGESQVQQGHTRLKMAAA
jgi:hypothetical protein